MAPFRPSRSTRSGRPTQDNDVMDGLPIRQWRLEESALCAVPVTAEENIEKDTIWKELPMPKDAHLYQPFMQQLLRAARAGQINKPVRSSFLNGSGDEEKENGASDGIEDSAKAAASVATVKGFMARKWSQVPRSLEQPEREYLAKRRKGLPSPYATWNGSVGPIGSVTQMRKTKVKKIDDQGNSYVLEVLVPEGQTVEGEIIGDLTSENAIAPIATPAPGTVVEGVGVANEDGVVVVTEAPIKRRPPPPRRKAKKGPGRVRKKVAFTGGDGVSASAEAFAAEGGTEGHPKIRIEGVDGEDGGDTTMGGIQEGDEEDEEGEETDEEGEDGEEDDDREEGELSPSPERNGEAEVVTSTISNPYEGNVVSEPDQPIPESGLVREMSIPSPQALAGDSLVLPDSVLKTASPPFDVRDSEVPLLPDVAVEARHAEPPALDTPATQELPPLHHQITSPRVTEAEALVPNSASLVQPDLPHDIPITQTANSMEAFYEPPSLSPTARSPMAPPPGTAEPEVFGNEGRPVETIEAHPSEDA